MISGYLVPDSAIVEIPFVYKSLRAMHGETLRLDITLLIDNDNWPVIWHKYLMDNFILTDCNHKTILTKLFITGTHRSELEVTFRKRIVSNTDIYQYSNFISNNS